MYNDIHSQLKECCETPYLAPPLVTEMHYGQKIFVYSYTMDKWVRGLYIQLTSEWKYREVPEAMRTDIMSRKWLDLTKLVLD